MTEPIVAIPGVEATTSVGDETRTLTLYGADMDGAWVNDARYFLRNQRTRVLKCLHVCWLEVGGCIENVPPGRWEVTLRVKCDNPRFRADWKIAAKDDKDEEPLLLTTTPGSRSGGGGESTNNPLLEYRGRWVRLLFGVLNLRKPNNAVEFRIFGNNPNWASGIHFGDVELRACGIEWEKERLLLLCLKGKANNKEGVCPLQELPREVIGLIAQLLITPHPDEINTPGSLLKRSFD